MSRRPLKDRLSGDEGATRKTHGTFIFHGVGLEIYYTARVMSFFPTPLLTYLSALPRPFDFLSLFWRGEYLFNKAKVFRGKPKRSRKGGRRGETAVWFFLGWLLFLLRFSSLLLRLSL